MKSSTRSLVVLFQLVLAVALIVLGLASVQLLRANGLDQESAKALGLLAGCIFLILVTERLTTGRWTRWSRR
ncbi:hypothetical protein ACFU8W_48495 [Streptomyces sp. NPDC057565]|uniref:hypothetical protein n=1 Tax=Streptomyces sp. NPDC057565 TaxID=3346169 RepID=UPI0036C6680D